MEGVKTVDKRGKVTPPHWQYLQQTECRWRLIFKIKGMAHFPQIPFKTNRCIKKHFSEFDPPLSSTNVKQNT